MLYDYSDDARTKWRLIKCDIGSHAISNSKNCKRKTKDELEESAKELTDLEEKICQSTNYN